MSGITRGILRKRLDDYFNNEGVSELVRIVIPGGSYVPSFERKRAKISAVEPDRSADSSESNSLRSIQGASSASFRSLPLRKKYLASVVIALVLVSAGVTVWTRTERSFGDRLYSQFWGEIFDPQRPNYVITGDSGLAMLEEMTGRDVHLHEYVTGAIEQKFSGVKLSQNADAGSYGADRFSNYTSTADLNLAVSLSRLPEFDKGHVKVRYARDVRMDLKQGNAVLLGGPHANPWIELFEPIIEFRVIFPPYLTGQQLDARSVRNEHPRPGEKAIYESIWDGESHRTYIILAFLPSSDHKGHALLFQRLNMAGTQAAGDFVLDRRMMDPILRKARTSDGQIGPFQILLKTATVGASAPEARVVLERYGGQ